jgi:hypothetical protein
MSHLIQTIDIDGTRYCVKHGASTPKWRTVSFLSDVMELVDAEDDDEWRVVGDFSAQGYIDFATCCLWKATIRATNANLESEKAVFVYINGALIEEVFFYDEGSVDIVIDLNALGLMGRACGNQWQIYAAFTSNFTEAPEELLIEIVDVTFGPPV